MAEIALFPSDQLVFVDETGFVCDILEYTSREYQYIQYMYSIILNIIEHCLVMH